MREQRQWARRSFPPITDTSESYTYPFRTQFLLRGWQWFYYLPPGGRMSVDISSLNILVVSNTSATDTLESFISQQIWLPLGYLDSLRLSVTGGSASGIVSGYTVVWG